MGITINGSSAAGTIDLGTNGTITDLAVGGLPDGTVDGDSLASTIPASKLTGALPAISGASLTGISSPLSFRNLVINGGMNVAQRGTSQSAEASSYICDRFNVKYGGVNDDPTNSQHALTSSDTGPWEKGFRNSLHVQNGNQTSNDGSDQLFIKYKVEAQDIANSGWDYGSASSKITLSFWLQTSVNQTFYGYVYLPDGGNSAHRLYSFSFTASGNNAWTKITKTIPGGGTSNVINNDNGVGLEILLCPGTGGNVTASGSTLDAWKVLDDTSWFPDMATTWWDTDDATFEITGVQLEVGDTATEFEHRSYGDELDRCHRYYQLWASGDNETIGPGAMYDDDTVMFFIHLTKEMRATPSCVQTSGTDYYHIQAGVGDHAGQTDGPFILTISNPRSIRMYNDNASNLSSVTGRACTVRTDNAASSIAFDAEI